MADSLKIRIDGDDGGFKKTLSGIEGVAKKGFSAVTKGVAATSAGIAALTTMAVKSYGEYEQLVGGIDTLFESSSKKVQQNAAKAYKTAGVSANQYMETATSIAASLKQSFDDTAEGISKAADVADMAIKDMSDNSNKMGTAMESIQWAYQGFAKQNYTMLDNLKLGYGGTKQEMERLLADAQKLTGIKYDISNLADVYTAIHVIQEELGITGTTALEASTTIVGSASMMKASWSNMMTGIADDNADMDRLMDELIDSVLTFADNIMPRVETAVEGIGDFASKAADRLIPELIDVFLSAAPELADAAVDTVSAFVDGISDNADEIASAAVEIGASLVEGIIEIIPQIVEAAGEIISAFTDELGKAVPALSPFTSVISMLADNIGTLTPLLLGAIAAVKGFSVAKSIAGTVTRLAASYQTAALQVGLYTAQQGISKITTVAETAALTAKEIIVGALTGKISLAAAAQALWNATVAAHPIGAIVVAITLLIGVIGTLCIAFDKETEAEKRHRKAVEENREAVQRSTQAIKERSKAMRESAAAGESSIDNTKRLATELQKLADADGRVAEADQGRAQFILGELNNALGTEYSMVDGVIQKYSELTSEIYGVIEAKRANVLASAAEETYTKAIEEQATVQKNFTNAKKEAADELAEYARLQAVEVKALKEYNECTDKNSEAAKQLAQNYAIAHSTVEAYRSANKEVLQNYWEAEDALQHNIAAISGYEQALAMINSGNINGAIALLRDYTAAAHDGTLGMQNMAAGSEEAIAKIGFSIESNMDTISRALTDGNTYMAESLMGTVAMLVEQYTAAGGKISDGFITGFNSDGLPEKVDLNPLLDKLAQYYPEAKELGLEFFAQYAAGIESGAPEAEKASEEGADAAIDGLKTATPKAADEGTKTATAYATGIASGSGQAGASATQIVGAVESSLVAGIPAITAQGNAAGNAYLEAFGPYMTGAQNTAAGVADAAVSGFGSKTKEFETEGDKSTESYNTGLGSETGLAAVGTTGGILASTAATSAATKSEEFKEAGTDAIDGYIAGLSDQRKLGEVETAAANIVITAKKAIQAAQRSSSPAKEFTELADDAVDGYNVGLTDKSNLRQIYNSGFDIAQVGERGLADGQNSNSPAKDYIELARDAIDGLVLGVKKNKGDYSDAMYETANEGEEAWLKGMEDAEVQETRFNNPVDYDYILYGGLTGEEIKHRYRAEGKTAAELEELESFAWGQAVAIFGELAEVYFADGWDFAAYAQAIDAKNIKEFLDRSKTSFGYAGKKDGGTMQWATLEGYDKNGALRARINANTSHLGIIEQDHTGLINDKSGIVRKAKKTSDAVAKTAKDAAEDVYKTHILASENSIKAEAEWMADILGIQSEATDNMIESEKKYFDEKARIDTERHYAEYLEKVNNAESIAEIEEIKQEYINEKARKGENRYLEGLRETAEKEKEIYEKRNDIAESLSKETPDTFRTVTIQDGENKYSYTKLADVAADNEELADYEESLRKLFERKPDLPNFIKNQLKNMGLEEGMNYVSALLRASDVELEDYISGLNEQAERSGNIANLLMTDEMEGFRDKLTEQFGEIPDGFFDVGENSAIEFGEGFFNQIKAVIESGKASIADILMGLFGPSGVFAEFVAGGGVSNNNYTNNYYLQPSGDSVYAQRKAIDDQNTYNSMIGEG
ncbi:MAG: hypothetical protein IKT39_02425 [Clostridia bacterium]|nr:hypothetical protein [Clostridia bacterium]